MAKEPRSLEDRIADALRESEQRGELQRARGWGKPLDFGDGYDETPADLRMGYKILKDAGAAPIEVEIMREIRALETRLAGIDATSDEANEIRRKISDLRLDVALRIEAMAKRAKG
jgi:hypothetical protein